MQDHYREIPLTRGYVAKVDEADYEYLSQFKWHAATYASGRVYARRTYKDHYINKNGNRQRQRTVLMHKEVAMRAGIYDPSRKVDHVNNDDSLDNRRSNIRMATPGQNWMNSEHGSLGVRRHYGGRWQARISVDGIRHSLGYYATQQEAIDVYRAAAQSMYGEFYVGEGAHVE